MDRLELMNPFARLFRMGDPFEFMGSPEDEFEDEEFDDDGW
jgi:hypothetical protein